MSAWIERYRRWLGWLAAGVFLGVFAIALLLSLWRGARERSQDTVILAAALRYNVHPALIKAVVWRESRFDPQARGTSGELGLMQIREPTAMDWASAEKNPRFNRWQLLNPGTNTQCGSWYLRRLLNRYRQADDPLAYALAAYNAGPSHVNRWSQGGGMTNSTVMLQQMDYPGTRAYVFAVRQRFERYRKSFPPKDWERGQRSLLSRSGP